MKGKTWRKGGEEMRKGEIKVEGDRVIERMVDGGKGGGTSGWRREGKRGKEERW